MVYLVGVIGFLSGFALGQYILLGLLKDKSNEELLKNRRLKFVYGSLNWVIAIVVCFTMVRLYQFYF